MLISSTDECGQPLLAAVLALAATTGLRGGEFCGLPWGMSIWRTESFTYTLGQEGCRRRGVGPSKTHQVRRIALDYFTIAVREGYVFTLNAISAKLLTPGRLRASFIPLCGAAGIPGMTLHILRDFNASMLIASGGDVRTIAGRLGHSDATTTLRVYVHVLEGRDQDAADYVGSLLGHGSRSSSGDGSPPPRFTKAGGLIS